MVNTWEYLTQSERQEIARTAARYKLYSEEEIAKSYNEYATLKNKYDGYSQPSQQMQIGKGYWQQQASTPTHLEQLAEFNRQREAEEQRKTQLRQQRRAAARQKILEEGRSAVEQRLRNNSVESNDNLWVEQPLTYKRKNPHLSQRAVEGAKANAIWEQEHPNLTAWGNVLGAAPFAVAAVPAVAGGIVPLADAAAATSIGQMVTNGLIGATNIIKSAPVVSSLWPYADAALTSTYGAHAIQSAKEGNFGPTEALEMTPLIRPVQAGAATAKAFPQYVRDRVYTNVSPIDYITPEKIKQVKGAFLDIVTGAKADIENPKWLSQKDYITSRLSSFGRGNYQPDFITKPEMEEYLKDFGERAFKARMDIWRMYNHIPQKYNTFVPNPNYPGAYTAQKDIEALSYLPIQRENKSMKDFINSVGGNVGIPKIELYGETKPRLGAISTMKGKYTIDDLWDLQPLKSSTTKLADELEPLWHRNVRQPLRRLGIETGMPQFRQIKKLLTKIGNIEFGSTFTGATPVRVVNEVPFELNRYIDKAGISRPVLTKEGFVPPLEKFQLSSYSDVNESKARLYGFNPFKSIMSPSIQQPLPTASNSKFVVNPYHGQSISTVVMGHGNGSYAELEDLWVINKDRPWAKKIFSEISGKKYIDEKRLTSKIKEIQDADKNKKRMLFDDFIQELKSWK